MLSQLQNYGPNPFTLLLPNANGLTLTRNRAGFGPWNAQEHGETQEEKQEDSEKKREMEGKLSRVYESFDLEMLWKRLSEALSRLQSDPASAQVLLPSIESLMVVSQHVMGTQSPEDEPLECVTSEPGTRRAQMESDFLSFTEKHRKILNLMVRQNPALMSGSFSLLVRNPKVLDFDNKRNYFSQQLHKGRREHYTPLSLTVRRQHVFYDSFQYFNRKSGPEIKHGKLNVRFHNEDGVDAGGVTREWFQVLSREMFNPDYALFQPCAADCTTYQPNKMSSVNDMHLAFFKFIGRVIGKAIYDGRLLDAYFTRSFYKHILGRKVDYRDLEAVDPEYYNSIEWMLNNDITDVLDLTFAVEEDVFGETRIIELKPGGSSIQVTESNKHEYVRLVTEQNLTNSIRSQIDAFLAGFHEIIPPSLIKLFSERELELLISGLPDIDVDEWKNNTDLRGYKSSDPMIQWWWRAVRSFDQTEKAKLLQFITGNQAWQTKCAIS